MLQCKWTTKQARWPVAKLLQFGCPVRDWSTGQGVCVQVITTKWERRTKKRSNGVHIEKFADSATFQSSLCLHL